VPPDFINGKEVKGIDVVVDHKSILAMTGENYGHHSLTSSANQLNPIDRILFAQ
jgi:hypothetical protein